MSHRSLAFDFVPTPTAETGLTAADQVLDLSAH